MVSRLLIFPTMKTRIACIIAIISTAISGCVQLPLCAAEPNAIVVQQYNDKGTATKNTIVHVVENGVFVTSTNAALNFASRDEFVSSETFTSATAALTSEINAKQPASDALSKITESGGLPSWNGAAWPGGGSLPKAEFVNVSSTTAFQVPADCHGKAYILTQSSATNIIKIDLGTHYNEMPDGSVFTVMYFGSAGSGTATLDGNGMRLRGKIQGLGLQKDTPSFAYYISSGGGFIVEFMYDASGERFNMSGHQY